MDTQDLDVTPGNLRIQETPGISISQLTPGILVARRPQLPRILRSHETPDILSSQNALISTCILRKQWTLGILSSREIWQEILTSSGARRLQDLREPGARPVDPSDPQKSEDTSDPQDPG